MKIKISILGSIIGHHKPIRTVKTHGRLRMLVEQLPNGRKRLHLKGKIFSI